MCKASKLTLLFALVLSIGPYAASAHPAILGNAAGSQAAAPVVKVHYYNEGCEEYVVIRRHCWRHCYADDCWLPRCHPEWGYHSRYYSHHRWGSYRRYWRPRCCGGSGWDD